MSRTTEPDLTPDPASGPTPDPASGPTPDPASGPTPDPASGRAHEAAPAPDGGAPGPTGAPAPEAAPGRSASDAHGILLLPTREDLRRALAERTTRTTRTDRAPGAPAPGRTAVVMTMGALHDGHAGLVRAARARVGADGFVVVTIFVNPLQFGAGEDLDRYPRTLDADLRTAAAAGADAVFAPSADEVYPGGDPQVRITAGPMGTLLEGRTRPGHFDGMLTVVAKLLHLTAPDVALFGQKDAQQLALIRRMVRDLNFPVEIVGVPTVREESGLALSSRNQYLSPAERTTALALSRALFAARDRLAAQHALHARAEAVPAAPSRAAALSAMGEARAAADAHALARSVPRGGAHAVRDAARAVLAEAAAAAPPLELDYLALVDPATFTEVADDHAGEAVLAVAARVGTTRLIDNVPLTFGGRQ